MPGMRETDSQRGARNSRGNCALGVRSNACSALLRRYLRSPWLKPARLGYARATGRDRDDHPLELPTADHQSEASVCPCGWMLRGRKAERAYFGHNIAAWPGLAGGGNP